LTPSSSCRSASHSTPRLSDPKRIPGTITLGLLFSASCRMLAPAYSATSSWGARRGQWGGGAKSCMPYRMIIIRPPPRTGRRALWGYVISSHTLTGSPRADRWPGECSPHSSSPGGNSCFVVPSLPVPSCCPAAPAKRYEKNCCGTPLACCLASVPGPLAGGGGAEGTQGCVGWVESCVGWEPGPQPS
jgi:hypothetical protein